MRIDQVSFDLLQHQEQSQEYDRLHRAHHKDQEKSDPAADKTAEHRDQGSKRNENPHQHSIRETENRHGHKEHTSQNNRLNALPCNKVCKGSVCQRADMKGIGYCPLGKKGI